MNTLSLKSERKNNYRRYFSLIIFSFFLFVLVFIPLTSVVAQTPPAAAPAAKADSACKAEWYAPIQKQAGATDTSKGLGLFSQVSAKCWACGDCELCDFLLVGDGIARFIFGIIGGVALLMFIYGGISFIISSGNAEKVTAAKGVLVNAVIGIVIIFAAWEIVHIVIGLLAGVKFEDLGGAVNIFNNAWFKAACK